MHDNIAVKVFPDKGLIFPDHVAVDTVFLGNGYGTGIEIEVSALVAACGNVGMSVDEDVAVAKLGRGVFPEVMTVGQIDTAAVKVQDRIICEDREAQYHLIDFGITVAAHAKQLFGYIIEKCDDFLGRITFGQVVARTVVEQVAEQDECFRFLACKCVEHLSAVVRGAVDVGCKHEFHM